MPWAAKETSPVPSPSRGADYVLALKGNQGGLFEDVQWLFEQAQASRFEDVAHSDRPVDRQGTWTD